MASADNVLIGQQNAKGIGDPTLATTINARAALRSTFDTSVQALDASPFPKATTDIATALNADASVESALGLLAANTDNVTNYNSTFDSVTSANATFIAANAAVQRDLGLTKA
jgi:hypothetical protein